MKRFISLVAFMFFLLAANAQTVYGPYTMTQIKPQPEGYTKVMVYSQPFYYGGVIGLTSAETGDYVGLAVSTSGPNIWYYYVKSEVYNVSFIGINLNAYMGTPSNPPLQVGDELDLEGISCCSIILTPSNNENRSW
jgi:hypothetical protein